jgi:hypothetical protein
METTSTQLTAIAINNDQPTPSWSLVNDSASRFLGFGERAAKRKGDRDMGQMVKCDICGKIYNESHLTTHKRRSHETPRPSENNAASVEAILSMYEQLPVERKREVLRRLAIEAQTKP